MSEEFKGDKPGPLVDSIVKEVLGKLESDIIFELASLNSKFFSSESQIELDFKMEKIWGMLKIHNLGLKRDSASAQALDIQLTGDDTTIVEFSVAGNKNIIVRLYKHALTGYLELRANKWGHILPLAHAPNDAEWARKKKEHEMKTAFDAIMSYLEKTEASFRESFTHHDFTEARGELSRMVSRYNRLFGLEAKNGELKTFLKHIQIQKTEHAVPTIPIPERTFIYILELQEGLESEALYAHHKP